MKIGQYIYSKLSADAAVAALVSDRIYPVFLPQNEVYPAIVFYADNRPLDKQKDVRAYHDTSTVTISIWADCKEGQNAYATLDNIDVAVRNALDFVEGTAGGVTVEACYYESSVDGMDADRMLLSRTATYRITSKN